MSDEMVVWLREQVAEDERVAKATGGLRWTRGEDSGWTGSFVIEDQAGGEVAGPGYEGGGVRSEEDAVHIARHDPARVLAEVAAKRRLIDAFVEIDQERARFSHGALELQWNALHVAVLALASVHRGRPGWRSAWAPDEEEAT